MFCGLRCGGSAHYLSSRQDLLADYERVSERVSAVQSTTAAVALEPVAEQVAETMAEAPQVDATQTTAAADLIITLRYWLY